MSKKESQYWIFNHATVHYRKHIHFRIHRSTEMRFVFRGSSLRRRWNHIFIKSINQLDDDETILIGAKSCKVFFQRSLDSDLTSRNGLSSKRSLSKYLIHNHHYPHNHIILILIQPYNPFIYIKTFIDTTILFPIIL